MFVALGRVQSICSAGKRSGNTNRWVRGTELPFSGKQVNTQLGRKYVNQITSSTAQRSTAHNTWIQGVLLLTLLENSVNY
jgi:uncharacterized protein YidB (DUF937 family)